MPSVPGASPRPLALTIPAIALAFLACLQAGRALGPAAVPHAPLWHNALALAAIVVSAMIFATGWSGHHGANRHKPFVLLSAGFLGVALLDASHLLSSGGMPDYVTPNPAEKAIGFRLASRYLAAASILAGIGLLLARRNRHAMTGTPWLMSALLAAACSEILFSLHADPAHVYGLSGRLFQVVAYLLLYRAVVAELVVAPHRAIQASQAHLSAVPDTLRHLKIAVDQSPTTIMITDLDSRLIYANPAFTRTSGYSLEEARGRKPSLLHSGKTPPRTYDDMWTTLLAGKAWKGELVNRRKSGEEYIESVLISPVADDGGAITSYLAIKEDITQRRRDQERLAQLANFDALTGLPNQRRFAERFGQALKHSHQAGKPLALLALDLDHFKHVNESLGLAAGDAALVAIAKRLMDLLGAEDILARRNGDEFIVALPRTDAKGAAQMAERIHEAVVEPCDLDSGPLIATTSIGIALYPEDGATFELLAQRAETALNRAKQNGRNGFQFYSPDMLARSARIQQIENALRSPFLAGQLQVVYQPQVAISTGAVTGVEALVRWRHPEYGAVSPAEFIPIAESCGQIVAIGLWVLRAAIAQASRWRQAGHRDLTLAVNLSLAQFRHPGLLESLDQALANTGFPAGQLELELTESIALDDPAEAVRIVRALRRRGIRLAIDDFGTGYSSLSHLKQLQLHKLKIDKSFVRGLPDDATDASIVTAIVNMAHSLDMRILAEGVETPAALDALRRLGCDEAQGYLFSPPVTAETVARLLERPCAIRPEAATA